MCTTNDTFILVWYKNCPGKQLYIKYLRSLAWHPRLYVRYRDDERDFFFEPEYPCNAEKVECWECMIHATEVLYSKLNEESRSQVPMRILRGLDQS